MTHRGFARAFLLATALGLSAGHAATTSPGTIYWDQYAVPHIYGPDIPTVVRGLGYAQMENHAESLLNNVARARGRSAEYFGPGTSNFNVNYDMQVRTYGIPARAQAWVAQGGAFQLSVLQAFCDGVNEYATRNPSQILPGLQAILPVVPSDITSGEMNTINWTFLPEQDDVPATIAAWQAGGIPAVKKLKRVRKPEGSNGWGIGPAKSADGNAILMGNPHLPWGNNQPISDSDADQNFGVYQWIEANLVIGNPNSPTLNASGVTFIGGPFIGVGFNDYLGWTHTNNTIQNADLYQLTLDSTGTKYLFGGVYLPLQHTTSVMKVLQPNGSEQLQSIDIYNSIHGPVVAFNAAKTQALALRVAGLNEPSLVTQYWNMIQSQTLTQFKAAESALQMPFFNTIYADRGGNIFYLFGGQQPVRPANLTAADVFNTVLDGTNPALLWTKTMTFAQLPQAVNPPGNFVANSNNPPWTTALPQPSTLDPANYPTYIAPSFMDFRPQHGTTFLSSATAPLTTAQVLTGKMSNEMYLADRVVGDLITLATAAGKTGDTTAAAAAAILTAWDHTADATSAGGPLFEAWWNLVVADVQAGKISADTSDSFYSPHPKFRVPWSASAPITTPSGLDPSNNAQLLVDLDAAYTQTAAAFGSASVVWGGAHKTTLVTRSGATQQLVFPFLSDLPLSGADDPFGPIRVVNPYYVGALGQFVSYGGDGYVQLIEFTPTGAQGGTLLTYGNASRPYSPHITDQLPFFQSETLKPALRSFSAVQAAAVSVEGF